MNQQKIFNFNMPVKIDSNNFYISNSNSLAHKALLNQSNHQNYLYLKGPTKCGKSHLGKIWQKNNNAEFFSLTNFEKIISNNCNIFIDNLSLYFDEEKLFHIINHSYNKNLKILITSEKSLFEYKFNINDLSSRLKTFYFVEIFQPDDELIHNLLIKLLHDKQINISNNDIFSFIIKRINRTYLDIYTFVDKIDKLSLSEKRQITIPLIKKLI